MSQDKQQLASELSSILELERSHLSTLLELLEQERVQILNDPEVLTAIASEKHKQVKLLEQLSAQHNNLLQQAGFTVDHSGMQDCIEWCGSPKELDEQWTILLSGIADCQEQNLKNGVLVELGRNRLSQLAEIFQGEDKQTSTYDQAGKNDNGQIPGSVSIKA